LKRFSINGAVGGLFGIFGSTVAAFLDGFLWFGGRWIDCPGANWAIIRGPFFFARRTGERGHKGLMEIFISAPFLGR
jgi:hypothetical protein